MQVRMLRTISGDRDGQAWPPPGGTLDVPDDEAAQLIRQGLAETTDAVPEAATVVDPDTPEKPKTSRRRPPSKPKV